MDYFKIGGVPEHFNLPWHLTIDEGAFRAQNIELQWQDFPGGTGAMCEALRNKEIDIAIILTEGIIKDIIAGNPSTIIQTYIQSPLIWGIHVGFNTNYKTIEDLKNTTAAISRYGSGSHLMAYVNAQKNNWDTTTLQFEVIKNLEGAVDALTNGSADYFMWEHFTTKPLVDNKTFRRIDDCPTPWPCFVIAVRNEIINTKKEQLQTILKTINATTTNFKNIPSIDKTLAHRYDQQLNDIKEWLQSTEWSQEILSDSTIHSVQKQLFALDIIKEIVPVDSLTSKL